MRLGPGEDIAFLFAGTSLRGLIHHSGDGFLGSVFTWGVKIDSGQHFRLIVRAILTVWLDIHGRRVVVANIEGVRMVETRVQHARLDVSPLSEVLLSSGRLDQSIGDA